MYVRTDFRAASTLVLLAAALAPTRAESQIIIRPGGRGAPLIQQGDSQQLFAVDREMTQRVARAEELIGQKQYSPALKLLQSILDQTEDLFYRDRRQDDDEEPRSLKEQVEAQLAALPADGERVYENEYGFTARQLLDESIERGDVAQMEEVVRRFFHTQAGQEATYRLAMYHFDRGEHLSAARLFERLRAGDSATRFEPALSLKEALCWSRGGLPQRALRALSILKEQARTGKVEVGGRSVDLFESDDGALAWLSQVAGPQPAPAADRDAWTVFRGNAARTGSSAPVSPIQEVAWTYDTILGTGPQPSETLQESAALLRKLESGLRDSGEFLAMPAAHPLVTGGAVVFRTPKTVRAVDVKTGATLWESAKSDPAFEMMLQRSGSSLAEHDIDGTGQTLREAYLIQRSWRDFTSGLLSSDGRFVYALEDLGVVAVPAYNARGTAQPLAPGRHNKLVAIDLATGRLKWEIGGERLQPDSELAGLFFLGPPLPIDNQLYCLAEDNGEIRLLAIEVDQTSPERPQPRLAWSQRLVYPAYKLEQYQPRRLAGLSPSFGDGVMVCPTAAGAVVGVDLTRRVLLWGYRYTPDLPDFVVTGNPAMFGIRPNMQAALSILDDEERWLDDTAVIDSGSVLLTPRDSSELHCLDAVDGSLRWKKPRGSGLFVAGVHDGNVIVVGRTQVQAYRIDDNGAEAWDRPIPIAMPSGRGVQTARFYHLPLSSGELVTIDLKQGRITARSASPDGKIPGNLVAAHGRLLSQSADALIAYRSLSEIEGEVDVALQENADDPAALARRGELRLHGGDEPGGLSDLRRAVRLGAGKQTRTLLSATLMEGLRLDFEKYRGMADELAEAIDDPQQQARYRRLYAQGLHRAGDVAAAFEQYLKLVDAVNGTGTLEDVNSGLSVRSDRWVSTRLADLYRRASEEQREQIDEALQARLEKALAEEGPEPLREFLAWYPGSGQAGQARRELVGRLDARADSLEIERHLNALRHSADDETAGWATAQLVSLYLQLHRPEETPALIDELDERWADVTCLDGRTGSELAADWRTDPEVAAAIAPALALGDAPLRAERSEGRNQLQLTYEVEIVGPPGPYLEGVRLEFDQRRQSLSARDSFGERLWEVEIGPLGRSVQNQYGLYARADGHLLAVAFGNFFGVFDALTPSGTPRILWKHELYDSSLDGITRGLQPRAFLPPGAQRPIFTDVLGRQAGSVGPITATSLVFQSGSDLYAADPLTGTTLWLRRGLPRGCEIFGDGEYVFALPPNADQAIVLRAGDGEPVGTRPVPEEQFRKAAVGRSILSWGPEGRRGVLALTDVLTGKPLWQEEFDIAASLDLIDGEEVAVLEPGGRFMVLNLEDGQRRVDSRIGEVEGLDEIIVRRSADRYLLLCHSSDPNPNNIRLRIAGQGYPQVNGSVHGFDRSTGRKLWTANIEQAILDPGQPLDLPVLVLVQQHLPVGRPGRPPENVRHPFAVTVLDTRHGTILYDERERHGAFPFEIRADFDRPRIDVAFSQFKIQLLPDDRRSVEAPATGD